MKELVAAINEQCFSCDDVGGVGLSGWVVEFDDVKEIIETMLAGKVIVDECRLNSTVSNAEYAAYNLIEFDGGEEIEEAIERVDNIVDSTGPEDNLLMVIRDLRAMLSTIAGDES